MWLSTLPRNDDWLRTRTWDLWVRAEGELRLVQVLSDLLLVLEVGKVPFREQKAVLRQFLRLPAAEATPPALRTEVDAFLGPPLLVKDVETGLVHYLDPSEEAEESYLGRGVLHCALETRVEWPDYEYLSPTTGVEQVTCPACRGEVDV